MKKLANELLKIAGVVINQNGRTSKVYGIIVAAGAGSITDPLERYDLTAHVS